MSRCTIQAISLASALILAAASGIPAQSLPTETGGIVGYVADTANARIAGAQVSIAGVRGRAETGPDGAFRMSGVPSGSQMLVARRIGFRPESVIVIVRQGVIAEVPVRMRPTPQHMTTVVVDGGRVRPTGRLRGFNERRLQGLGHYFTAADIERRNPAVITDLLRMLPGVRINRQNGQNVVTFRGQRCPPLIWIDGAPATAGYLDPDVFSPGSLAGIEVYMGTATVPAELMWVRGLGSCGVIALWTAVPEPTGRRRGRVVTAQELANLVATLKLYTADQVDTPVAADTLYPITPLYPDSMLRAGVPGRTIVEFVVDTAGLPDMETFGAIASTDPMFTEAARRAVGVARFIPAVLAGARVRQLVQLPITFAIASPVASPGRLPDGSRSDRPAHHPGQRFSPQP
jgi:TonB family protein